MRQINEIVIHATDTRPDWMSDRSVFEKVAEIRRWHKEDRGWRDIGYNWIIDRDGSVAIGRDTDGDGDTYDEIGAHTKGYNKHSLGIALVGGYGCVANGKFADNYTPAQETALIRLMGKIQTERGTMKISGHNQYANKACPGFSVEDWLNEREKPPRASITESKTLRMSQVAKVGGVAGPIIGYFSDMPWQSLAVLCTATVVVLWATGVIDAERFKKWRRGDR